MIGRAAQGRPWLPSAIESALRTGSPIVRPSRERALQSLIALYDDTLAFYGRELGVRVARKHIAWMIDAELGADAREARKQICTITEPNRVRDALTRLFEDPETLRRAA
jgi:tRNA-dihydrouridine synthase